MTRLEVLIEGLGHNSYVGRADRGACADYIRCVALQEPTTLPR